MRDSANRGFHVMVGDQIVGVAMRVNITAAAGAVIALTCCPAAQAANSPAAHAASFSSQQILILGSPAVSAQAINNRGTIVGTYQPQPNAQEGFILQGSALYGLASSNPTAVNRAGEVAGVGSNGGFVWQNGSFVSGVSFPVGEVGGMKPAVLLNNHGIVAYTAGSQSGQQVYAGAPRKPRLQKGLSANHAVVTAINDHGVLAGFEEATINGNLALVVFVGKAGLYDMLLPNGSNFYNTPNVALNDANQVAFSNGPAVFLYSSGVTTMIALPTAQAMAVQVGGIDNRGRVAGVYTDNSQTPPVQSVFFYNGHNVSTYGSYAATDTVHVAMNGFGIMVVSDTPTGSAASTSYRVTCLGAAC